MGVRVDWRRAMSCPVAIALPKPPSAEIESVLRSRLIVGGDGLTGFMKDRSGIFLDASPEADSAESGRARHSRRRRVWRAGIRFSRPSGLCRRRCENSYRGRGGAMDGRATPSRTLVSWQQFSRMRFRHCELLQTYELTNSGEKYSVTKSRIESVRRTTHRRAIRNCRLTGH
jgi:hypothetical protein